MISHILKYLYKTRPLLNLAYIERSIGIPSRALADAVGGTKQLPAKWDKALTDWWTGYAGEVAKVEAHAKRVKPKG